MPKTSLHRCGAVQVNGLARNRIQNVDKADTEKKRRFYGRLQQ
jgi:hypothetical protein